MKPQRHFEHQLNKEFNELDLVFGGVLNINLPLKKNHTNSVPQTGFFLAYRHSFLFTIFFAAPCCQTSFETCQVPVLAVFVSQWMLDLRVSSRRWERFFSRFFGGFSRFIGRIGPVSESISLLGFWLGETTKP